MLELLARFLRTLCSLLQMLMGKAFVESSSRVEGDDGRAFLTGCTPCVYGVQKHSAQLYFSMLALQFTEVISTFSRTFSVGRRRFKVLCEHFSKPFRERQQDALKREVAANNLQYCVGFGCCQYTFAACFLLLPRPPAMPATQHADHARIDLIL